MTAPLVYLILGIPGSGRREVLFDLLKDGVDAKEQVLYFRPEGEVDCTFDEQIEALDNVSIVDWKLDNAKVTHGKIDAAPERIIFLAPGTSDPADAAEAVKTWTDHNTCQIGRIITVTHCAFLSENSAAQAWFDACIHFSDIVLLNRREDVNNKWIRAFEMGYHKQFSPARFLMVKKGRVANPLEVLEPEARRLSLYFDELIPIEDDEFEDDEQPQDTKPDKYIERLESGHRAYPVPDIKKLL
ncbi:MULTISPECIES: hypothetical protein [unclassified Lentimonas]|uniref:hypothetical protein n=1 Tax=unclassified Lentimonas TaxID=2630993 RepID=UPI0013283B7C|nr:MULTISPECIES: hypothetical protein [unclassified Lentimonas]CAA6677861.1 Unannotated [Lentimonas sp. CC4]CAA6683965.1 Unannotated [Lentimonas sp. CC6]CAA7076659.1 Unannotated [Lentimonas sp. CC4]CAA7170013.1 Unannotated [Lentimonas sp. CC21]CAA7181296.1 Unannotated [Lentimonas sp. CC8]